MRTIKFKCWDKKLSKWVDIFTHKIGVQLTDVGLAVSTGYDSEDNPTWDYNKVEFDRYEFLQFTGLKDRHGKEIYEGDIVYVYGQFEIPCDDRKDFEIIKYRHTGTIVFENGSFVFKNHLSKEKLLELQAIFQDNALDTDITSSIDSFTGIEILGNIHENPELLTNQ
jgi:uncharacterized phage protein (TIGR01671 family)